jgi:hypothetical protein
MIEIMFVRLATNLRFYIGRGKVKTKHDITCFAQKTNVDQLNSAYVYDSGGVKNFVLFTL